MNYGLNEVYKKMCIYTQYISKMGDIRRERNEIASKVIKEYDDEIDGKLKEREETFKNYYQAAYDFFKLNIDTCYDWAEKADSMINYLESIVKISDYMKSVAKEEVSKEFIQFPENPEEMNQCVVYVENLYNTVYNMVTRIAARSSIRTYDFS